MQTSVGGGSREQSRMTRRSVVLATHPNLGRVSQSETRTLQARMRQHLCQASDERTVRAAGTYSQGASLHTSLQGILAGSNIVPTMIQFRVFHCAQLHVARSQRCHHQYE